MIMVISNLCGGKNGDCRDENCPYAQEYINTSELCTSALVQHSHRCH